MNIKKVLVVCKKGTIDYYRDLLNKSKKEAELLIKYKFNAPNLKANDRKHRETIAEIHKVLSGYDVDVVVICRLELDKKFLKDINLIISVGGDGTLLRVAHFIENELLMGVNSNVEESEGQLTKYTKNDFARGFKELMEGKANIINVTRVEAKIDGNVVERALNEVFIGMKRAYETSRYIIKVGAKEEKQKSSGIIFSSGAGSTAWYKSAKGKSFDKTSEKVAFLVREPYFGKLHHPTIVDDEIQKGEKVVVKSKMFGGVVVIDSLIEYSFEPGSQVEICISDKPLKMVELSK